MNEDKIYNCLILNNYQGKPYASMVYHKIKTLETRMRRFKYEGDLIICCGNTSTGSTAGFALCLVHFGKGRPMTINDQEAAQIECIPGRIAYPLTNVRYFNRLFSFSKRRVSGSWQGIFKIKLPDDIQIK